MTLKMGRARTGRTATIKLFTRLVIATVMAFACGEAATRAQDAPLVRIVSGQAEVFSYHPAPRGDRITTVPAGATFEVIDREADWYWILLPWSENPIMRSGWVRARDVEVILDPPPTADAQRPGFRRVPERDPFYARIVRGPHDDERPPDSQNGPVLHRGFIE